LGLFFQEHEIIFVLSSCQGFILWIVEHRYFSPVPAFVKGYSKASDEDIIQAIIHEGKTELFGLLYDRYADKVFRKCISFVQDRDIAQDMVQDVLLKVFTQLSKFKGNSRFSTWLYAITYNYCVEYYRRSNRYPSADIDEGPDIAEPDDQAEKDLLGLRAEKLHKAMSLIAPEDKAILLMKYQDDTSIKDLTEHLDASESAVKMRLARARERVRALIQEAEQHDARP
jgi:RNA polymerase sigma-70 factor (ECF subfamily)